MNTQLVGSRMGSRTVVLALSLAGVTSASALAGDTSGFVQGNAYRQGSDSPFISNTLNIDDFESGLVATGVTTFGVTQILQGNSVDADDGLYDGLGADGKSLLVGQWGPFIPGTVTFEYDVKALGGYPTQVGGVVTATMGSVQLFCVLADGSTANLTYDILSDADNALDDVFIGYASPIGIASMRISCEIPIMIDHVQHALPPQFTPPAVSDDFDGDGKSDVAWANASTPRSAIWHVNGTTVTGDYTTILPSSSTSKLVGTGDADANGKADMLWYDPIAQRYSVWIMNGFAASATVINRPVSADWIAAGYFDVNGDRNADVVFRRTGGGQTQVAVWLMSGATIASAELTVLAGEFDQLFVGNLDPDSNGEALLRKTAAGSDSGAVYVSDFTGSSIAAPSRIMTSAGALEPRANTAYSIVGLADIAGDGASDVIWRGPTGSVISWNIKASAIFSKSVITTTSTNYWTIATFPDFDGDGTQGIFFRGGRGETWSWRMVGGAITESNALNTVNTSWKTTGMQH